MSGTNASTATIDQIATLPACLMDDDLFVARYGAAIRAYVRSLVRNDADAEDVFQQFVLDAVVRRRIQSRAYSGRFRDYLKASVRNAVVTWIRQHQRRNRTDQSILRRMDSSYDAGGPAEERRLLLDRVLGRLQQQDQATGRIDCLILTLVADHPRESSHELAGRAASATGRVMSGGTFRQHVRRARLRLAILIRQIVAESLDRPSPRQIAQEIERLGMSRYLDGYTDEPR